MGHSAFVVEAFDAKSYHFLNEVKLLSHLLNEIGMTWDIPDTLPADGFQFYENYLVDGFATGEEYIDKDGDPRVETLEIYLDNLNKSQHADMNQEPNFPFQHVKNIGDVFKCSFFINDISWNWDKALRLIVKYMQVKKDQMPLVTFEDGSDKYYTLEDCLKLYHYCDGDHLRIDSDVWFGKAWEEMLKTKKPYSMDDIAKWF